MKDRKPFAHNDYEIELGNNKIYVHTDFYFKPYPESFLLKEWDYEFTMKLVYDNNEFTGTGTTENSALVNLSEKIKIYKQVK